MSGSLRPHGWQHARLPCPPLSLGVCSNSCPLSQWCYLTISSSAAPYSFTFSLSQHQSFPMSWVFTIGGQSIGIPASASVLPMNIQGWFPFGLTSLISLPGTFKSLLQHHSSKASILQHSAFFMVQLTSIHNCWKNYSFDYMDLCRQSDVFLSRFVHSFYSMKQVSFNFVTAVTLFSDFGAK